MKYCDQCGAQLNDKAKFCTGCGAKFGQASSQSSLMLQPDAQLSQKHSNVDTTEYLKRCVLLEKNIYTQNQIIHQLRKKAASLGIRNEYAQPRVPHYESFGFEKGDGSLFGAGATVGGIIGLFTGNLIFAAILGGCICLGIFSLIKLFEIKSNNSEAKREYQYALKNYNSSVENDKKRVTEELVEKNRLLNIISDLEKSKKATETALERFYGVDILFPKYRNLIATCSLYEYFLSGRYTTLTGPDGAYNRYETEVRLDKIITKLDHVIARLDAIKANQFMLFDAIQEGNRLAKKLVDESVRQSQLAAKTAENTALAAHYSEVAANNAEACAWIGLANHIAIKENTRKDS